MDRDVRSKKVKGYDEIAVDRGVRNESNAIQR